MLVFEAFRCDIIKSMLRPVNYRKPSAVYIDTALRGPEMNMRDIKAECGGACL